MERYTKENLHTLCDVVGGRDADLKNIITTYGYPPLWLRANTFATLVLTILEQQVSLASAYAAYKKLVEKLPSLTPQTLLQLSDAELRACYFSRQKISYVRGLATLLANNPDYLEALNTQPDDVIRTALKKLKGIGDWTVDIYLIHALQRHDVFPLGDLALVNALKSIKRLPATTTKQDMLKLAIPWQPYRTFATLLLWHWYLQKKGIRPVY